MKEITTEKLRRFNLIMGGLHLIQGIAMLFLATNVIQKIGEFSPEISQFYLAFNPETRSLETASRVLFELPFGFMVASFLFISAFAHALALEPVTVLASVGPDGMASVCEPYPPEETAAKQTALMAVPDDSPVVVLRDECLTMLSGEPT